MNQEQSSGVIMTADAQLTPLNTPQEIMGVMQKWHSELGAQLHMIVSSTDMGISITEDGTAENSREATPEETNAFKQGVAYCLDLIANWPFRVYSDEEVAELQAAQPKE